ncbi:MAG: 16S rRNA (cytidine(1402)-2'-O)-methyltransferase [Deltaproteobacteria bacterium]|nr:MAG: 16S rRNA (cytidine(1402)-2'-O)-methyltransferase [Deltaproteobacteria bacterium]
MPTEPGTLYLVATPIGNLEDITLRALRLLREADLVAAEDTRRTRKLLSAHNIRRRLLSYHEHNLKTQGPRLLRGLAEGKSVALVTDAGTPGISDPGMDLVRGALVQGIQVTAIPGPSAVTTALTVSGLPTHRFLFLGFPPSRPASRRAFLTKHARTEETLVLFESPKRLAASLRDMRKIWGNRKVTVAREMTKVHEEVFRGNIEEAIVHWPTTARGEITLLVAGAESGERTPEDSLIEHLKNCLASDRRPLKQVASDVAQERGISRRLVYQEALKLKRELSEP